MTNSIISILLHQLNTLVRSQSYELLEAQNQLRKRTDSGFHNVIVAAGAAVPTLVELHLGIRINIVEDLVYQFTNGISGYGPHSTTLIASAGRIEGMPYLRYELNEIAEVPAIVQQMNAFLVAKGFDFLQKNQRIEALNTLYNTKATQKSLLLPNLLHRSLRGIVLAKLTQQEDWMQLAETYRLQLMQKGIPGPMIQRYVLLTNYLQTFSVN